MFVLIQNAYTLTAAVVGGSGGGVYPLTGAKGLSRAAKTRLARYGYYSLCMKNSFRVLEFMYEYKKLNSTLTLQLSSYVCIKYRYMDVTVPQDNNIQMGSTLSPADLNIELADSFSLNEVGWFSAMTH